MKIGKVAPLSCGNFYYSSVLAKQLNIWVKDYEELRPEPAAGCQTFTSFYKFCRSLEDKSVKESA